MIKWNDSINRSFGGDERCEGSKTIRLLYNLQLDNLFADCYSDSIKICTKCQEQLPEESFCFSNKALLKRRAWCRGCVKLYDIEAYKDGRKHNKNHKENNERIRNRNLAYLKNLLQSASCLDCGNTDWRLLEFDHIGDKKSNVAALKSGTLQKIIDEISKCEIVCANCHRLRTYTRCSSWRML